MAEVNVTRMLESYELPGRHELSGLDELGLVDAIAVAALMESAALEVRLAAIARDVHAAAPVG